MKTISNDQFLQLVGLITLARTHNKAMDDIAEAVQSITGELDEHGQPHTVGHSYDAVWDNGDPVSRVREMLRRLEIEIVEKEQKPAMLQEQAGPVQGRDYTVGLVFGREGSEIQMILAVWDTQEQSVAFVDRYNAANYDYLRSRIGSACMLYNPLAVNCESNGTGRVNIDALRGINLGINAFEITGVAITAVSKPVLFDGLELDSTDDTNVAIALARYGAKSEVKP